MKRIAFIVAALATCASVYADRLGQWEAVRGDWTLTREIREALLHPKGGDAARAAAPGLVGCRGAWRCVVEPGLGATVVGMTAVSSLGGMRGLRCQLGGYEGGGFSLRAADDTVLWADEWAPWIAYEPYILEVVIEQDRARVQMLTALGVLVSQSPWIGVDRSLTERSGILGAYSNGGPVRVWEAAVGEAPVADLTDDAPNKRRLAQGPDSDWRIVGGGSWMWTDSTKQRVKQSTNIDRAWAVNRADKGKDRLWQTYVRVGAPAGGAGLCVKANEEARGQGLLMWLGGTYGAGSLIVYKYPEQKAIWSSPQDKWHYDEDLLIQAETKGNKVQARLIKVDGGTTLVESPWLELTEADGELEGLLGFHTWKGPAEFWGFSSGTAGGASPATPTVANAALKTALGDDVVVALDQEITGARGTWRCKLSIPEGPAGAGLIYQAERSMKAGFVAYLTDGKIELIDLAQPAKPRFEADVDWQRGKQYTLEGIVTTDRVAVRLLDGDTELVASPDVYISDTNNDRVGAIGTLSVGGEAVFSGLSFEGE